MEHGTMSRLNQAVIDYDKASHALKSHINEWGEYIRFETNQRMLGAKIGLELAEAREKAIQDEAHARSELLEAARSVMQKWNKGFIIFGGKTGDET